MHIFISGSKLPAIDEYLTNIIMQKNLYSRILIHGVMHLVLG